MEEQTQALDEAKIEKKPTRQVRKLVAKSNLIMRKKPALHSAQVVDIPRNHRFEVDINSTQKIVKFLKARYTFNGTTYVGYIGAEVLKEG